MPKLDVDGKLKIQIAPASVHKMTVVIKGLTPLLTNKFSERAQRDIEDKQTGAVREKRPPRDPEAEYRDAMHTMPGEIGRYYFPASGIKQAMIAAGYRYGNLASSRELKGVFSIPLDLVPIICEHEPIMRRDPVSPAAMKGSFTLAYRPEFFPWSMAVPIRYNANLISPDHLVNLLSLAGEHVGIGSWRTECDGTMGIFEIANVTEAPQPILTPSIWHTGE